jgi:hypothetical protein
MSRAFLLSMALLAGRSAGLHAQTPVPHPVVTLASVAGVWYYRAMIQGGGVVESVLTATATKTGWVLQHDSEPPVPVRVVKVAGDSIVMEAGPYASTLRPGQTVTRLRVILHYRGDWMTGPFSARYASGDSAAGRADARRRRGSPA